MGIVHKIKKILKRCEKVSRWYQVGSYIQPGFKKGEKSVREVEKEWNVNNGISNMPRTTDEPDNDMNDLQNKRMLARKTQGLTNTKGCVASTRKHRCLHCPPLLALSHCHPCNPHLTSVNPYSSSSASPAPIDHDCGYGHAASTVQGTGRLSLSSAHQTHCHCHLRHCR